MVYGPGTLLVMDRGYNDYAWFAELTRQGVYFVTRLKNNADYLVMEERELPHRRGLLRDQVICFYRQARDGQESYFRRIEFYDEEQDRVLVFVTNHLKLAAATVAEVYKQRWPIELFFENSTWCTPLDVYGISRVNCAESTVGGVAGWFRSATHRSTSALRRIQGAPTQACVAGNCFSRINRKTVVGVTPRTDGGFTDGHLAAGLPFSLTVDRNRMVVAQRADTLRRPGLSVCRAALIAIQDRRDPCIRFDPRQPANDLHQIIVGDIPMPAGANLLELYLRVIPALPMQYQAYGLAFTRGDDLFQSDTKEAFLVLRQTMWIVPKLSGDPVRKTITPALLPR